MLVIRSHLEDHPTKIWQNPNRLQHYFQFQVVFKPSPENIVDLYLESLFVSM